MRHLRPVLIGLLVLAIAAVSFDWQEGARAETTTAIEVGDLWFCDSSHQIDGIPPDEPCATVVNVGDTVVWQDIDTSPTDIAHTVTQCGTTCDDAPPIMPLFDSRSDPADDGQSVPLNTYLDGGETYSFAFDSASTYLYRCELHPTQMRGQIIVLAAEQPTPTPSPTPTPTPTPTPAVVPAGGGPPAGGPGTPVPWWLFLAAGGGLLMSAAIALAVRAARPA